MRVLYLLLLVLLCIASKHTIHGGGDDNDNEVQPSSSTIQNDTSNENNHNNTSINEAQELPLIDNSTVIPDTSSNSEHYDESVIITPQISDGIAFLKNKSTKNKKPSAAISSSSSNSSSMKEGDIDVEILSATVSDNTSDESTYFDDNKHNVDNSIHPINNDDEDDSLIQLNPDYQEEKDNDEEVDEEFDDSGENNYNPISSKEETKSMIGNVLSKRKPLRKNMIQFIKKHRIKITIALFVFAFRKEIRRAIYNVISQPVYDPQTKQIIGRKISLLQPSPTSILKVLFFVQAVRHIQQRMYENNSSSDSNDSRSMLMPSSFLLSGPISSILIWIVSDLLSPTNPAYVPPVQQHYTFEFINIRHSKDIQAYNKVMSTSTDSGKISSHTKIQQLLQQYKQIPNRTNVERAHMLYHTLEHNHNNRIQRPSSNTYNSTLIVMDWTDLDSSISSLDTIRDQVSFLIDCYHNEQQRQQQQPSVTTTTNHSSNTFIPFEVVVLLESPGGSASEYAIAAQQIIRLKHCGMKVTICVDKVAASGGYMIACTSSPGQLYASKFAVLGSIGVIGQSINIHKLLEGWGITPLVFRGGKDKAPVGLIGEVTKTGMNKVQVMVDDTHRAFKRHVIENRPLLTKTIDSIATGDIWLGYDAINIGLIDRIISSDEYLEERLRTGTTRILKLLKIVRGRSIFSKPQTSVVTQQQQSSQTMELLQNFFNANHPNTIDILSALRTVLDKTQNIIGSFLLSTSITTIDDNDENNRKNIISTTSSNPISARSVTTRDNRAQQTYTGKLLL